MYSRLTHANMLCVYIISAECNMLCGYSGRRRSTHLCSELPLLSISPRSTFFEEGDMCFPPCMCLCISPTRPWVAPPNKGTGEMTPRGQGILDIPLNAFVVLYCVHPGSRLSSIPDVRLDKPAAEHRIMRPLALCRKQAMGVRPSGQGFNP